MKSVRASNQNRRASLLPIQQQMWWNHTTETAPQIKLNYLKWPKHRQKTQHLQWLVDHRRGVEMKIKQDGLFLMQTAKISTSSWTQFVPSPAPCMEGGMIHILNCLNNNSFEWLLFGKFHKWSSMLFRLHSYCNACMCSITVWEAACTVSLCQLFSL